MRLICEDIYRESSTSICLTTLGNIIIFSFGTISLFPVIRSFCIFCVVSLIFVFIFQMTLFGAFLALDGNREIHRTTFAEWLTFASISSQWPSNFSYFYFLNKAKKTVDGKINFSITSPFNL